jgi:hypothetical protein
MALQINARDDRRLGAEVARARPRACVAVGLFAVCLTPLLLARCGYSDYPIEPTFCDDWCHTLRRIDCDQEPENCVRACEADREPRCAAEHEALRACYQAEPPGSFVCVGQGFGADIRPRTGVCQGARDVLIACAAPDEWECLQVCREVDAAQFPESDEPLNEPEECPARDIPCGNLCRRLSDGDIAEQVAGLGGTFDSDAQPSPEQLRTVLTCAAIRGRNCREADRAGQPRAAEDWQYALFRCATTGSTTAEARQPAPLTSASTAAP